MTFFGEKQKAKKKYDYLPLSVDAPLCIRRDALFAGIHVYIQGTSC